MDLARTLDLAEVWERQLSSVDRSALPLTAGPPPRLHLLPIAPHQPAYAGRGPRPVGRL